MLTRARGRRHHHQHRRGRRCRARAAAARRCTSRIARSLGHVRHESGHYYWDRLIAGRGTALERFASCSATSGPTTARRCKAYYANGPPADWQERFISAYASAHPLEDWAETWAHYLHMVDTLETAAACGVSLQPRRADEPSLQPRVRRSCVSPDAPFDQLIDSWFPVTYVLNNLNRGMGLADAYPFVWSPPAIEKLRFVHEIVSRRQPQRATPSEHLS